MINLRKREGEYKTEDVEVETKKEGNVEKEEVKDGEEKRKRRECKRRRKKE